MKRDEIIDICKGIGMLLVILGHLDVPFGKVIYAFHMPLFFYLSGRCFSDKNLDNIFSFIKKRFIGLLIPVIVYEGSAKLFLSEYIYETVVTPYNIFGTFWFLKALFAVSVIFLCSILLFRRLKWNYSILPIVYLIVTFILSIFINVDSQSVIGKIIHYIYMATFFAIGYSDRYVKVIYNENTSVSYKRMGGGNICGAINCLHI